MAESAREQVAVSSEVQLAAANQVRDVALAPEPQCGGDAPQGDESFVPAEPRREVPQQAAADGVNHNAWQLRHLGRCADHLMHRRPAHGALYLGVIGRAGFPLHRLAHALRPSVVHQRARKPQIVENGGSELLGLETQACVWLSEVDSPPGLRGTKV